MTALPFGQSAYSRANGRLPSVRLVNLFPESAPTAQGGVTLLPRFGMHPEYAPSADDLRGLYIEDGVFGGALMSVAGEVLFNAGAEVGTVAGDDLVEWAYTVDGLFICSGGSVYVTEDGATVTATAFPDSAPVASITAIDNFLVAVRQDTGTVYFRIPGDTTWNALDFFSAEREPDPAIKVATVLDLLYVFGTSSVELFTLTGDATAPFSRLAGSGADRGLRFRDAAIKIDNTIVWPGENSLVYRMAGVPTTIGGPDIAARVEASEAANAWRYSQAGHEFCVLRLESETLVWDASTGEWFTADWPVSFGIYDGHRAYVAAGPMIYTLRDRSDDAGVPMERVFTALAATDKPGACDCIEIELSPGTTPVGTEAANVQLRWSDDQGRTWSDWKAASTGAAGQYRHRVRYRRLGMIDAPGRIFEIRITDPVAMRFSGVEMNPPGGGRSRG